MRGGCSEAASANQRSSVAWASPLLRWHSARVDSSISESTTTVKRVRVRLKRNALCAPNAETEFREFAHLFFRCWKLPDVVLVVVVAYPLRTCGQEQDLAAFGRALGCQVQALLGLGTGRCPWGPPRTMQ